MTVPSTSTQELFDEYAQAKDRCSVLIEQLRTQTLPDEKTSEEQLKAQLVAELLRIKALKQRIDQRS
jgi:glycine cleavage system regulatory protein